MNKQITLLLLAAIVWVCPCVVKAQCVADIKANTSCGAPAVLRGTMNRAPQYLEWSRIGAGVLRRDTAVHASHATTIAGTGTGGAGLNQLNNPSAVYAKADGTLYISEQGGQRVVRWAPGATQGVVVAGSGSAGNALTQLNAPVAIHVGVGDTVYVLEYQNHRVTKWGPGASQGIIAAGGNNAGSNLNQLNGPHGFYVQADGTMYIAEFNGGRIIRFPPGSTSSTNGTVVASGISQPMSVTFDQSGNMYVGTGAGTIIRYPPSSSTGTTVATGTARTRSLYVDKHNNIWVAEDLNFRIVRYPSTGGTPKSIVGTGANGTAANQLFWPSGFAIDDSTGILYVVDYGNHRIQKFAVSINDTLTATVNGNYVAKLSGFSGCVISDSMQVGPPDITVSSACGVPALLTVSMNAGAQYLEWSRTGDGVIRRDTVAYAANAVRVAGNGTQGSASNQLQDPGGIFLHASGSLYVSEQGAHRISKWTPGAVEGVVVAGGSGAGSGLNQLNNPVGVHVGTGDTVFVVEFSNNRVTKWGPGVSQGIIAAGGNGSGTGLNQLNAPHGFFVAADGSIYIAEYNGNRIMKFPAGSTQATSGTVVTTAVVNPVCVVVDQSGNVFVGENGGKIIRFPAGSSTGTTIATGTQRARGMLIDKYNNLWVAEDRNHRIVRYLPGSAVAQQIVGTGSSGNGASQLCWPSGLAIEPGTGDLYVADYCNYRVQRFSAGIRDTFTATVAGEYTVQVKGFNGCTATDAATISPSGPSLTPGSNPSVCMGVSTASLPYSNATGSPNQYSISWNTAAQTAGFAAITNQPLSGGVISIAVPGAAAAATYNGTLTVRNSTTGCVSNTYNISVQLLANPAITPGSNPAVCAGVSTTSLSYSGATGSPNQYSIAWNTAATTAGFTNVTNQALPGSAISIAVPGSTAPAVYSGSMTVRNSSTGCFSTAHNISVTVHAHPSATTNVTGSVDICAGNDTLITAGSGTGYVYEWKDDQGSVGSGISYAANTTGNYYVVVTDANNCKDSTAPIPVTVYALPQVSIAQGDTAFCTGGFVRLDALSPDTGIDYRWKEGSNLLSATANFIEVSASGSYSVVVNRSILPGCADSAVPAVNVTVHPLPVAAITWDGSVLYADAGYPAYQWYTGSQAISGATNASFEPVANGAYTVTVTDSNGCSSTSVAYNVQVGIAGITAQDINVYPNPASTQVYIQSPVSVRVSIHSVDGRQLGRYQGTSLIVDVRDFPDGIYTISITGADGELIRNEKLVKHSR